MDPAKDVLAPADIWQEPIDRLLTGDASFPVTAPLFNRRLQPHLDQPQYVPIDDAPCHRFEEIRIQNRVEVFRYIHIDRVRVLVCE